MELIEYEQVIPEINCFCKVFHSQLIEKEKKSPTGRPLPHWHSSYEFNVCINGRLENHIENEVSYIESEEFVLINPNVVHTSYEVSEDYLGFAVLIPEEYIRMYFENPDKKQVLLFTKQNYAPHKEEIWRLLYKLYLYSLSTASNRIIGMNSCILSIFTLLLTENEEEEESADTMDALSLKSGSQYTDYVNVHYRENIQLKDVASHFGFTTAYFSKLFYRETGRNFKFYLSTIRLSHAVFLLKSTDLSITEIADRSGFPKLRAFTDLFLK
ncbi:AraC family transcriptional regulator, partial [Oribacterium sinus]